MRWTTRIATATDYPKLVEFYRQYYPLGHPLYHLPFWQWQFGEAGMGKCILAENEAGELAGHVGSVPGGGQNFLINILVSKSLTSAGLIGALFDAARNFGPLTVAVANAAGAGLLRKKGWQRHYDLLRYIWVHPDKKNQATDKSFFSPIDLPPGSRQPDGLYWQQPFLQSFEWAHGNCGVSAAHVGGLRIYEAGALDALHTQAADTGIRWMDMVVSWNDPLGLALEQHGWQLRPGFPWFIQPLDLSRQIELNLFSETGLINGFMFSRQFADMGRVGSIPTA